MQSEHQPRALDPCPICGEVRYWNEEEQRGSGGCMCWVDEERREDGQDSDSGS